MIDSDEDVHSAIERLLGPVGRKIHAGRSRNDQVVTAFRLWALDACAEAKEGIEALAGVVLDRAEEDAETVMPGYTHLQRAQPVTLGHHLLAWVEMLDRDRDRFALAARHAEASPLGAGALAGTTLPLPGVRNSLDAVADRDFALDYLYACAALFVHLSRIGEELALWSTAEFGFVRLPDSAATGSSMMPQKLNPDVAELARGKAGTAIGRLTGLLATVKGLPLSYNSDLGEDKPAAFAARRDVRRVLAALVVLVRELRSTKSGWRRPPPIRVCSRRTRRRRSSRRASRSATRTSRSPARAGGSVRPGFDAPPKAPPPGSATSAGGRRSAQALLRTWGTVPQNEGPRVGGVGHLRCQTCGEGFASVNRPAPEGAPDDGALAAQVAQRAEVVERRDPAGGEHRDVRPRARRRASSRSGPARRAVPARARDEQAGRLLPPRTRARGPED